MIAATRRYRLMLVAFIFSLVLASEGATSAISTHAGFLGGNHSLELAIEFPQVDTDVHFRMLCDMDVGDAGNIIDRLCHVGERRDARKYQTTIYRALRKVDLVPASREGKPHRVWMQFSVEFLRDGAARHVRVYLNHGHDAASYGPDYISAQRFQRNDDTVFIRCETRTFLWVRAVVGADGVPVDPIDVMGHGTDRCKRYMKIKFVKERFIPALYDGKYVDSTYAEPFFNAEPR